MPETWGREGESIGKKQSQNLFYFWGHARKGKCQKEGLKREHGQSGLLVIKCLRGKRGNEISFKYIRGS